MNHPSISGDLQNWYRGRGRERQFFATDEEVQDWLNMALPSEYEPYYLTGADLIKKPGWDIYRQVPFQCHVSQLLLCMKAKYNQGRFSFYIWSKKLNPDLRLMEGEDIGGICSYNGLIILQHGSMIKKLVDPTKTKDEQRMSKDAYRHTSRIAMTYKMTNLVTGEGRQYDEYLEIYESLKKTITKALRYTCIVDYIGGEGEDTHAYLWTEGAVKAYNEGYPFFYRPGNLIEKKKSKKKPRG